jgi:hypothetical protein
LILTSLISGVVIFSIILNNSDRFLKYVKYLSEKIKKCSTVALKTVFFLTTLKYFSEKIKKYSTIPEW